MPTITSDWSDEIAVQITAAAAPTIQTSSLPQGVAGTAYDAPIAATSSTAFTWSLPIAPAGFQILDVVGLGYRLRGTAPAAGDYAVRLTATNGDGATSVDLLLRTVAPAADPIEIEAVSQQTTKVFQSAYQLMIVRATRGGKPIAGATITATPAAGLTLVNTSAVTQADGTASFLMVGTAVGATSIDFSV